MSVTLRLSLTGKKHFRSYRIVAANTRDRRDGKPIDTIGFYNPTKNPPEIKIDQEKVSHWLKNGALVSPKVKELIGETTK